GFFLRDKSIGTVWFDDLEVVKINDRGYLVDLQYPNYRQTVRQGDTSTWVLNIKVPSYLGRNKLTFLITNEQGEILANEDLKVSESGIARATWRPNGKLAQGDYL